MTFHLGCQSVCKIKWNQFHNYIRSVRTSPAFIFFPLKVHFFFFFLFFPYKAFFSSDMNCNDQHFRAESYLLKTLVRSVRSRDSGQKMRWIEMLYDVGWFWHCRLFLLHHFVWKDWVIFSPSVGSKPFRWASLFITSCFEWKSRFEIVLDCILPLWQAVGIKYKNNQTAAVSVTL